ncbi:NmrA family NAD(P)-binding protein [Staphylococcus coagulans]|nr:NmrA family NAD(P)-binding protein [Staphylococcus coagulans]MBA8760359.1 NmrA family NAD(P)-binding protein [Staphylococcus coagulans]MBA8762021.1 NmrA family NAD(P)-binding protein [Staphylococcus coagulans]MBA8769091.1 NmrA family NAD(P)-binding protein [Staphylococcus coagulans]
MNKRILVIGAMGNQGFAVVQQLLAEGFNVTAFTRNKRMKS